MKLRNDEKFEEKLTRGLKNNMKNMTNFHQNSDYEGILLSKVEKRYELKSYRRVMCHGNEEWCKIWKRHWLVISKLTWGIWQILMQVLKCLKNVHLHGLLLNKVYNIWAKKVQQSYVWWHWRLMQNLRVKLNFAFKN